LCEKARKYHINSKGEPIMLSKEFERKIATLEDLPELREITWQMRAALEKAYKETLKDLNRSNYSGSDPKLKKASEDLRHAALRRLAELELYGGDMFGFELVNPLRKLAEDLPNFSKNDSLEIGKYHWAIRREEESKNNN
jgi:hypothetical protein